MLTVANAGVPMIVLHGAVFVFAFVPIVLIELAVLMLITRASFGRLLVTSCVANACSTIVGIPVTWLVLMLLQMMVGGGSAHGLETTGDRIYAVTIQAPWLIPYEEELGWIIPTAALVMLVPFFIMSWLSEWYVALRMLQQADSKRIARGVLLGNIATYLMIAGYWCATLAISQSSPT
ncbi:MAG: hypothetical protein RIB60_01625 [Phycisphaerales bacterium]